MSVAVNKVMYGNKKATKQLVDTLSKEIAETIYYTLILSKGIQELESVDDKKLIKGEEIKKYLHKLLKRLN